MKKLRTLCCVFMALCPAVFALPGVTDYLPTFSGEYVYYRDYTFVTDTWIGFLQYDNYTYAVRYYSPRARQGLPEIVLYVTLNSEKNGVELSGEKIASPVSAADTDTVNYMHDVLYALSSQRKDANGSDFSKPVRKNADMYQFGGGVMLQYDYYIPVFNLSVISGQNKKPVFEAVTFGRLTDAEDTSFTDFKPDTVQPVPFANQVPVDEKAKKTEFSASGQKVSADSQWQPLSDTAWAQGDNAVLILDTMAVNPQSFEGQPFSFFDYAVRTFSLSSPDSYALLSSRKEERSAKKLRLENVFYSPSTKTAMRDIKLLREVSSSTYAVTILTVYDSVYQEHKSYYERILSSVKAD